MENKKLKLFREKLVQRKKEILEAYEKNKTYGKEADEEGAQDIADKASNSYTKEFLFSLSNNERDMLQLVDEALIRIDDRRFGTCVVCEEELDRKRLEAVPWAKRCISCQEKREQGLLGESSGGGAGIVPPAPAARDRARPGHHAPARGSRAGPGLPVSLPGLRRQC